MNFLLGGRTGDLIHSLYVAKHTPGKHNLYITDRRDLHSDGFALGLEKTYEELYPILMAQDYVNSFEIYTDQPIDKNLSMWREVAYSANWAVMLSKKFDVPVMGGPWINFVPTYKGVFGETLVHCSVHEARRGKWTGYIPQTDHYFIGNDAEYAAFGYNMKRYQPDNLNDMFEIIHQCTHFIGNQSAPLAIAHALDVPRTGILNYVDANHYLGEEKIYQNFKYVL